MLKDLSSKKIMLGVLDLGDPAIEPTAVVADRIRNALKHVPAERLVVAPDCGMKYMPRHDRVRKAEGDERGGRGGAARRSASAYGRSVGFVFGVSGNSASASSGSLSPWT